MSPAPVMNIRACRSVPAEPLPLSEASLRPSGLSSSLSFPPPAPRRAPSLEERSLAARRAFLISRASAGADSSSACLSAGRGVTANLWRRRRRMKAASVAVPSGSVIQPYALSRQFNHLFPSEELVFFRASCC